MQRGENAQPVGLALIEGSSVLLILKSVIFLDSLGSGTGAANSCDCRYGCFGFANASEMLQYSTMLPKYITMTFPLLPIYFTVGRSWVIISSAVLYVALMESMISSMDRRRDMSIMETWTPTLSVYDRDILQRLQLPIPSTFSESLQLMDRLQAEEDYVHSEIQTEPSWWKAAEEWSSLFLGSGGSPDYPSTFDALVSPESMALLNYISQSIATGKVIRTGDGAQASNLHRVYRQSVAPNKYAELIAHKEGGPQRTYMLSPLLRQTPTTLFDASVKGVGLFQNGFNLNQRWRFVNWMFSDAENDAALMRSTCQLPCRSDLPENPAFSDILAEAPYLKVFIDCQKNSHTIIHEDKLDLFTHFTNTVWKPILWGESPEKVMDAFVRTYSL